MKNSSIGGTAECGQKVKDKTIQLYNEAFGDYNQIHFHDTYE